jgi:hypothetical protein
MKKASIFLALTITGFVLATAQAQPQKSDGSGGPHFGAALSKLFGDNQAFTTHMEFEMPDPSSGHTVVMPGKMSFDSGKSRFEMNLSDIKGSAIPPSAAAQMKAMGMDSVTTISRPDKQVSWIVYGGLKSYFESPLTDKTDTAGVDDFTAVATEMGKEVFDGHSCVKNKIVVSDKNSNTNEFTVWTATDLKNFPIRIETPQPGGGRTVFSFKDVSFAKPDAGEFEPPAGFTKYASPQEMMQAVMKQMGGGMGRLPGQ